MLLENCISCEYSDNSVFVAFSIVLKQSSVCKISQKIFERINKCIEHTIFMFYYFRPGYPYALNIEMMISHPYGM